MYTKSDLLDAAALFCAASDLSETLLSYRMFGDTKKLASLRQGAGITLDRYNAAMGWLAERWPDGAERPPVLAAFAAHHTDAQPGAA